MSNLLSLQFYFTSRPSADFKYTTLTVIIIALLFAAGFGISYYRKKRLKDAIAKKLIKKVPGRLFTFGSILLLLLLVREVAVPILAMRIWWFILGIVFIWWLVKVFTNYKKEYNRRLHQKQRHTKSTRFIPKQKK